MFRALWTAFWLTALAVVCYFWWLNVLFPPDCALRQLIDGYHLWDVGIGRVIFGNMMHLPSAHQMMMADAVDQSGFIFFALCMAMMVGAMMSNRNPGSVSGTGERYAIVHATVVMIGATLFVGLGRFTGYSMTQVGGQWCEKVLQMIIRYGMGAAPVTYGLLFSYYHSRLVHLGGGGEIPVDGPDGFVDGFFLWALGLIGQTDAGEDAPDDQVQLERDSHGRTVVGPS